MKIVLVLFFLYSLSSPLSANRKTKKTKKFKKYSLKLKKKKSKKKDSWSEMDEFCSEFSVKTSTRISNIIRSIPFQDSTYEGGETLGCLRSRKDFSTTDFNKEALFFYDHISLLSRSISNLKDFRANFPPFIRYYNALLKKYWRLYKPGKGDDFTPEFSLEFTIEIIKQGNDFEKVYDLVIFFNKFSKEDLFSRLEEHEKYALALISSSLFYLQKLDQKKT